MAVIFHNQPRLNRSMVTSTRTPYKDQKQKRREGGKSLGIAVHATGVGVLCSKASLKQWMAPLLKLNY